MKAQKNKDMSIGEQSHSRHKFWISGWIFGSELLPGFGGWRAHIEHTAAWHFLLWLQVLQNSLQEALDVRAVQARRGRHRVNVNNGNIIFSLAKTFMQRDLRRHLCKEFCSLSFGPCDLSSSCTCWVVRSCCCKRPLPIYQSRRYQSWIMTCWAKIKRGQLVWVMVQAALLQILQGIYILWFCVKCFAYGEICPLLAVIWTGSRLYWFAKAAAWRMGSQRPNRVLFDVFASFPMFRL